MKLQCLHSTTCLPDYFNGSDLPYISIPAYKMSFKALKAALHSEISQGAFGGNEPLTRDDSGVEGDRFYKAAHAAVNRIRPAVKGTRLVFTDIEANEDYCDTVMAYFVFCDR